MGNYGRSGSEAMEHAAQDEALSRNSIGLGAALVLTLAFMAPAMSVFFTTPGAAGAVGAQVPFVYLVAMIGVLCTGSALAQFSRRHPSSGSFVTFISRAWGGRAGIVSALVLLTGYTLAASTVIDIFGSWTHDVLERNLSISVPWWVLSIVGAVAFTAIAVRGLSVSTEAAIAFFAFEVIVLIVIAAAIIFSGGADGLSLAPFSPSALGGGGFGAAVALAVYSFIGYEAAVPLGEETRDPRRNTGLAVLAATVILGVVYVLVTYSAVIGYGTGHMSALAGDSAPFDTLTQRYLGGARILVDIAGFTSICGSAIAILNVQPRILYNVSRAGLLPGRLDAVHSRWRTPYRSILAFAVLISAIPLVVGAFGVTPLDIFVYVGTFAGLPIVVIYAAVNLALIADWLRRGRRESPVTHLLVPVLGIATWALPIYYAIKPGQPSPFNWTWVALVIPVVLGLVAAFMRPSRDHGRLAAVLSGETEDDGAAVVPEQPLTAAN